MSDTAIYTVPGMNCDHCKAAVTEELSALDGIQSVEVDLDTKLVKVTGTALDDVILRTAITEAGYEVL
jgi:copper chaperone